MQHILITGGAGFIGSHLTDELIAHGYRVRILDNLSPQVHGQARTKPDYLNDRAELIVGDVRDPDAVKAALQDMDAVFHLAASVGVGQSMYEIKNYIANNTYGTSVLCQCLIDHHPVRKFIVASSMSIYGEGMYRTKSGAPVSNAGRSMQQLKNGQWEPTDRDGHRLEPIATPEDKPADLSSIYALSKYDQERMCLIMGRVYRIPTVALRFFNVFGPRQALSNPYTGVLAIFAARLLNHHQPLIFEDGFQRRDFVSIHDIVRACRLALETRQAENAVFNIGSGRSCTILETARLLARVLGSDIEPVVTGKYRAGDIRHCFAEIGHAAAVLGYTPQVTLEQGMEELTAWLSGQAASDRADEANDILHQRGLTI